MMIVCEPRGAGKTTLLAKYAKDNDFYLVVAGRVEEGRIRHLLKENAPKMLTFEEFLHRRYHSPGIKGFVIDNVDLLLQEMSPSIQIFGISLSKES